MKLKNPYQDKIIINALMRGGIVPDDVHNELPNWTKVGYIACFDCLQGRSSLCDKPPIKKFLQDVANFFGGDVCEHTFGCRGAQFAVMRTISNWVFENPKYTNTIIIDPNAHYTTNITAEMAGLKVVEVPHMGYPKYIYNPKDFEQKIKEVKEKEKRLPALVFVTHADPYYGNIAPVDEIGNICEEYEIPYAVNVAYTGGVAPIDMRRMKASFLTLSAHKSMASLGPLGYLVTNNQWSNKVFATSESKSGWTGKKFGNKIPNIFGCAIGGIPLISSILSFNYVKERTKKWEDELSKINKFVEDMEVLDGVMLLGEKPKRHHLLHFETERFFEISKTHPKKGFFLAEAMIEKGIVGLHRGMSKHIKFSIYGLSSEETTKVKEVFYEIAKI